MVSPYLVVSDASATIEFTKRVFAATELRKFSTPDGRIAHAEVRLGETVVMLGQASADWPAVRAHVHVFVADVDATYKLALAEGATSVQEPRKGDDEDKRGGIKDSGGTTWWIATRVA
jgi:uncharacterized glyoxalase superfamily protein PhnB